MRATGRATTWRDLALLAVLAGLLGMHGLGGAQHHASPPTGPATTAGPAQHVGHAVAAAGHTVHEVFAVAGDQLAPACHDNCPEPGVAALCLAVLTAVAFGLLAAARAFARRTEPVGAVRQGWVVRPPPPLRFDPVADLCVSRT